MVIHKTNNIYIYIAAFLKLKENVRYMDRKAIHRKFNNIVSKIKQKKADYRTVNDWIAAMDMLQEFINGQRFIDFSIGEYRWNSMLTFIEQMMMIANKANEMPNIFAKQL
uniref:Uncharacterized protein LOC113790319 n=1 Tax=Dermatophagoides pteronyssinus TaxID=6956 RepID=A0A6P6XQU3_DERPT|nr:uncharacterized protein LOC113790319 [Dermatophagoides pteronyssinus]